MWQTMNDLLIIDLESTCHERGSEPAGFFSEIIEIGAVLLDTEELKPCWDWSIFVKPVLFPALSPFCMELTTITQAEADGGVLLRNALEALMAKVGQRPFIFSSWGFYDRRQFERNCQKFKLPYPFGPRHLSLKHEFARFTGENPMGMDAALELLNLPLVGTHHRGLDDARNIATIAADMIRKGWKPQFLTQRDFLR